MAIEEFGDAALVIHDQRGQGHGRRLYRAFREIAAVQGCTPIKAIARPSNATSVAFHTALGMRAREDLTYSGPG